MDSLTIEDPKKVEQGKRLAEHNKQKREEFKRLKEDSTVQEKSSFLPVLLTLTVVAGIGTYFYFKHTKKKQPPSRPKILSRLEKI